MHRRRRLGFDRLGFAKADTQWMQALPCRGDEVHAAGQLYDRAYMYPVRRKVLEAGVRIKERRVSARPGANAQRSLFERSPAAARGARRLRAPPRNGRYDGSSGSRRVPVALQEKGRDAARRHSAPERPELVTPYSHGCVASEWCSCCIATELANG